MNEGSRVRMKAIPTDQQVEKGHRKDQTSLKVDPNPVHDFREMANGGQHGQNGFDKHAFIMVEGLAHLQIGWVAFFGVEAMIGEDHGTIFEALDQRVKGTIMHIGHVTRPLDASAASL